MKNNMTKEKKTELLIKKSGAIGKMQARSLYLTIAFAVLPFVLPQYAFVSPFGVSAAILAWFGYSRAGAEIAPKLKELIEDYNYGLYGGAVDLVWSMFYSRHGKKGTNRTLALMSYPLVFTLSIWGAYAGLDIEQGIAGVAPGLALIAPSVMVLRLTFNRMWTALK